MPMPSLWIRERLRPRVSLSSLERLAKDYSFTSPTWEIWTGTKATYLN